MTAADRKEAFDLIQQLRGNLMERDAITPADLTPAASRTAVRPAPSRRETNAWSSCRLSPLNTRLTN